MILPINKKTTAASIVITPSAMINLGNLECFAASTRTNPIRKRPKIAAIYSPDELSAPCIQSSRKSGRTIKEMPERMKKKARIFTRVGMAEDFSHLKIWNFKE